MMTSGILTETLFIIPVYLFKKYPAFTANFVKIYDLDRVCKQYPYQGQCLWYYCHGIAILKVHPVHVINIEWCQVAATRCSCFDDGLFHLSASSVLKLIFGLSSDSLRDTDQTSVLHLCTVYTDQLYKVDDDRHVMEGISKTDEGYQMKDAGGEHHFVV